MNMNIETNCLRCVDQNVIKTFQVVSQYSNILSPIAVDTVLNVIDPATADNVDLKDIRIIKKLGLVTT